LEWPCWEEQIKDSSDPSSFNKTFETKEEFVVGLDDTAYNLVFLIVVLGGVHCVIYKCSYTISNISFLNSSPPSFSFIPLLRHS
jgi:hypothetical protein